MTGIVEAILAGDARSCARLITRIERGDPDIVPVVQALYRAGGHARIIGVTGPPGAGKSTLVDHLVQHYRQDGLRVAVLAVDPSSPLSGGALLGDRVRMMRHDTDPGVFVRSMASRGSLGGLSKATGDVLTVLDAMKWDVVIVETVGVGQNEVDIMRHSSAILVLQTALGGDAVQASKAGVLEIGHIFVVNKADTPGTERMVAGLRGMLDIRAVRGDPSDWRPPILQTEAVSARGLPAVLDAIEQRFAFLAAHADIARDQHRRQVRARVFDIVSDRMRQRLMGRDDTRLDLQMEQVVDRSSDPYALAAFVLAEG